MEFKVGDIRNGYPVLPVEKRKNMLFQGYQEKLN